MDVSLAAFLPSLRGSFPTEAWSREVGIDGIAGPREACAPLRASCAGVLATFPYDVEHGFHLAVPSLDKDVARLRSRLELTSSGSSSCGNYPDTGGARGAIFSGWESSEMCTSMGIALQIS